MVKQPSLVSTTPVSKNQPSTPEPTAIFIGRFQPFHVGHLDAVRRMQAKHANITILIGSSNCSRTKDNPLTFGERRTYIRSILGPEIPIFPLPDDPSDEVWLSKLMRHIKPGDVVYSGNDWVLGLCRRAGVSCLPIPYVHDISATRIRGMITQGDRTYENFLANKTLPKVIFEVLRP